MTVDPHQPDVAQPPSNVAQPPTFAALGRRVSSWTSKGLVSALVLAAGLAFGSQVLRWWRADSTLPSASVGLAAGDAAASDGLGDPAREHRLRFGESPWAMSCRTVVASKHNAQTMLRAACAESIRAGDGVPESAPTAAENEWLARVGSHPPVQQEPGRWALYELEEPDVMVVGTRDGGEEEGRRKAKPSIATPPSSLIFHPSALPPHPSSLPPRSRVVTWGMAIPGDGSQWTLYTLQWMPSAGDGSSGAVGAAREAADVGERLPPCPPGSTRILSIQATGGGAMVSFRGAADVEEWKRFFDAWVAAHHWTTGGPWRQYGLEWHLHCESRDAGRPGTLDLHVGPDGRGGQSRIGGTLDTNLTTEESEH